jgi:proline racemase
MRATRVFSAVDSHTEGMPTRVITGGVGVLPGSSMIERREHFERERDDLRRLLMFEPRGHSAMSGAILQPPTRPDADVGVLFIEVSGCLAMCGHGTIGVCTVLVETGMVTVTEPVTTIRLDTPAGLVTAEVEVVDGAAVAVTITNVASFLFARDVAVEVPGFAAPVVLDIAFGGNFYAIVPAERIGLDLRPERAPELIARGLAIVGAVDAQVPTAHPLDARIGGIEHLVVTAPGEGEVSGRAATVIHPGWIDRSPCGTGTSARMASLHARGELGLREPYVHESLIGSRFTGTLIETTQVGPYEAVIPTIRGRAWVTGLNQYLLDPTDPYPAGFLVPTVSTGGSQGAAPVSVPS